MWINFIQTLPQIATNFSREDLWLNFYHKFHNPTSKRNLNSSIHMWDNIQLFMRVSTNFLPALTVSQKKNPGNVGCEMKGVIFVKRITSISIGYVATSDLCCSFFSLPSRSLCVMSIIYVLSYVVEKIYI